MAEFTEVIKQKQRMCKSYEEDCEKCGISLYNNGNQQWCGGFILECPQEAEELIMKWAEEHPIKTNADVFKEVFGIDINKGSGGCSGMNCPPNKFCSECNQLGFWDREYKEQSNDQR